MGFKVLSIISVTLHLLPIRFTKIILPFFFIPLPTIIVVFVVEWLAIQSDQFHSLLESI
jgi:hypothetical protein